MKTIISTNWCKATRNYVMALQGLISAIEAGKNAWIEIRKNGEQKYPIMVPNPALNHPREWTMSYGTLRDESKLLDHKFLNETEKDLTYNYTTAFGSQEAIDAYYETGVLTKENFLGMGICHAVKIKDAIEYRKNIDGYNNYYQWVTFWKPREGVHEVPAEIDKVFTICYDDQPIISKKKLLQEATEFIATYLNDEGEI